MTRQIDTARFAMARFLLLLGWLAGCFRSTPFAVLAAGLFLSSCAQHSRTFLIPPSTIPVRESLSSAQGHAVAAKAAIAEAKNVITNCRAGASPAMATGAVALQIISLALDRADTEIDALTAQLLNGQTRVTALDGAIAQQSTVANTNAERAETAIAKASTNAKWRNYFLLTALALTAFIFRKPLLSLVGVALRAARLAIFPV